MKMDFHECVHILKFFPLKNVNYFLIKILSN